MSTEKKTIVINPDLFKLDGSKTKKSKPKDTSGKMKESPSKKELTHAKNNTLKRNILKMIREKQQDEYKRLFSKKPIHSSSSNSLKTSSTIENTFSKEFDKSLQYLTDLEKKVEKENLTQSSLQHTFRTYPNIDHVSLDNVIVSNELPLEFQLPMPNYNESPVHITPQLSANSFPRPMSMQMSTQMSPNKYVFPSHPGYGCLKNGSIPTYRTYKNQTSIQSLPIQPIVHSPSLPTNSYSAPNFTKTQEQIQPLALIEREQVIKEVRLPNVMKKIQNRKQRKIFKRTYRVGKCKNMPKISCLISNKTIRKKIQQTTYELKHTNMKDVRKFLLKRGFIKVGTTAPNDVLRKMYESVATICGEVQNHNPENLLFNFVNDSDS